MFLEIHEMVCSVLGTVPMEFEFVYGICDILVFIAIIWVVLFPFIFLYKTLFKRW